MEKDLHFVLKILGFCQTLLVFFYCISTLNTASISIFWGRKKTRKLAPLAGIYLAVRLIASRESTPSPCNILPTAVPRGALDATHIVVVAFARIYK